MSQLLKAADDVEKLVNTFQSLGTVMLALRRLGGMEQAEQELAQKYQQRQIDLAEFEKRMQSEADAAAQLRAAAEEYSRNLRKETEKSCAEKFVQIDTALKTRQAEADSAMVAQEQKIKDLSDQIFMAEAKLSGINASIEARQYELDAINSQLAEIRSRIGSGEVDNAVDK
jgi:chromosome segregation ATPase